MMLRGDMMPGGSFPTSYYIPQNLPFQRQTPLWDRFIVTPRFRVPNCRLRNQNAINPSDVAVYGPDVICSVPPILAPSIAKCKRWGGLQATENVPIPDRGRLPMMSAIPAPRRTRNSKG